jgi:cytochrome c oxidase subunit II
MQTVFEPQGPAARAIADLGWLLFTVCGVVYVLVLAALVWAIVRRRHDSDDAAPTTARLARAVTAAVILTALTLVGLTAASVVTGRGLTSPSGPGAITVDAIGHQWWWDFQYRDVTPSDFVSSPNELHIPVGVPVVIKTQSRDVIHSFWVPNLHGKRDLTPGIVSNFWIQADTPGVYRGQCAEFCGYQHAKMSFVVVAEPMEKFLAWIQHQRQPAAAPATPEQQRGQEVFLSAPCVTCHTVRGTTAGSRVGPDLTHVASRATIAAGTLPNTRGHLSGWISDPQATKPGTRMPPSGLSASELQAVLSYVRSLR